MKHLMKLASLSFAVLIAGPVSAVDLTPIPAAPGTVLPAPLQHGEIVSAAPVYDGPVYIDEAPIPLFECVKYVDKKEMHPCAIPKIIAVNDPCARKDKCNTCCEPQCVYIQICVPPCGCENVKCRRDGDRVRYDYGKYAVDVRVKKGHIVVDYQK